MPETPDAVETTDTDFDDAYDRKISHAVLRGWTLFAVGLALAAVAVFVEPLHDNGWWTLPAVWAMIIFYVSGHDFGTAAALRWVDANGWGED